MQCISFTSGHGGQDEPASRRPAEAALAEGGCIMIQAVQTFCTCVLWGTNGSKDCHTASWKRTTEGMGRRLKCDAQCCWFSMIFIKIACGVTRAAIWWPRRIYKTRKQPMRRRCGGVAWFCPINFLNHSAEKVGAWFGIWVLIKKTCHQYDSRPVRL